MHDATRAWATGADGTVLRTRDGGRRWEKMAVPGGEKLDFRDVEILPDNAVLVLASGPGELSRIYRSTDDGKTWTLVHTNPDKDGFYDAIAFWDDEARGGPRGSGRRPFRHPPDLRRRADLGGAASRRHVRGVSRRGAFAASGTCLAR